MRDGGVPETLCRTTISLAQRRLRTWVVVKNGNADCSFLEIGMKTSLASERTGGIAQCHVVKLILFRISGLHRTSPVACMDSNFNRFSILLNLLVILGNALATNGGLRKCFKLKPMKMLLIGLTKWHWAESPAPH